MCVLDNKLQTFFNLVLFQQLCGREVCGMFFVLLHASDWKLHFCRVECLFQTTFAWPIFTEDSGMILLWNICSSTMHVNRIKETGDNTVQYSTTPTEPRQLTFLSLCVA